MYITLPKSDWRKIVRENFHSHYIEELNAIVYAATTETEDEVTVDMDPDNARAMGVNEAAIVTAERIELVHYPPTKGYA